MTGGPQPLGEDAPGDEVPAKVDPESLVLRAKPARVTRFRRSAIVALAGAGATVIAGAGWLALGSPVSLAPGSDDERAPVAATGVSDALAGAPMGYGDIPKLGPALPGDLGRPILERQRQLEMAGPADPAADAAARAAQQAETERQRVAAEQRAARESAVMMRLGNRAGAALPSAPVAAPDDAQPQGGAGGETGRGAQQVKTSSSGRASAGDHVNPHRIEAAVSPWTIQAGSVLAASLITGLNSDAPGIVTAQVTQPAYDSVTGKTLLVPQGSRLIGSYDNVVAYGQSRALVVWQRIILPDGSSIRIDNVPAADTQGYAGLADRIDRHTWQLLKGVALSTLLGVGTELGWGGSESDLVRAVRESAQQNGARAGDQLVARSLDIQPTLKVRPGWPLRVVVHKDIVMRPWGAGA